MLRRIYTIAITTRNRISFLLDTCRHITSLHPPPSEIIVTCDGCSDGSAEALRTQWPQITVVENLSPEGSIPARDRMMRMATGDIVISLDDDSYPIHEDFLERLDRVLDERPEAAVVTFRELSGDGCASDLPRETGRWVSWFANCGAAYRRELYGELIGFAPHFEHTYEEVDYALQAYSAGYGVWREPSLIVRHHFAPTDRAFVRRHAFQARNETLSILMRCPTGLLIPILLFRWLRQVMYSTRAGFGWLRGEPMQWRRLWPATRESIRRRRAVSYRSYWFWFRLSRGPKETLEGIHLAQTVAERES